ncbi:hypothetical protein ACJMK2_042406, partial [Sinanodonta woodiana]
FHRGWRKSALYNNDSITPNRLMLLVLGPVSRFPLHKVKAGGILHLYKEHPLNRFEAQGRDGHGTKY